MKASNGETTARAGSCELVFRLVLVKSSFLQ